MEIKELFSYLSNQSVVFIDTMKITNRTSFATNKLRNFSPPLLALFSHVLLPYTINNILLTRKDKYGNFYIKSPIRKPVKLKSNKFEGNLYVLINGGSFSAPSILSANLKNINRATFVGEETGGAYNSTVAGTLPILTLPYSKLRFRVGLQDIGVIKKTDTIGRGIFPDVEIKPNELDLLKDIDPEIEYIVKREKLDNK